MKKALYIFSIFIFAYNLSIGQELNTISLEKNKGLSEVDFIKAKDGYLKMSLTQDFKNLREASMSLAIKLGDNVDLNSLKSDEALKEWISNNYKLTHFKNAEEGIGLIELTYKLQAKIEKDNPEVFELVLCANVAQLKEIYKPEFATYEDEEHVRTESNKMRNDY